MAHSFGELQYHLMHTAHQLLIGISETTGKSISHLEQSEKDSLEKPRTELIHCDVGIAENAL